MLQLQDYYRNGDEKPPSPSLVIEKGARLLPALNLGKPDQTSNDSFEVKLSSPIEIQRPSSALHAGDFTEDGGEKPRDQYADSPRPPRFRKSSTLSETFGTSPTTPWFTPSSSFGEFTGRPQPQPAEPDVLDRRPFRAREPSLSSCSSSYVLKAPTTPLVQEFTVNDLDFDLVNPSASPSASPTKCNRRHTLPPHALYNLQIFNSAVPDDSSQLAYRRGPDSTHPKHYARRSLTTTWSPQPSNSPQASLYPRSRKLSYSEASPLQKASMVGSYEESILRGSMSTAPSKPLDFTAQIGVLGKGTCKPKCPAHVTIPFPAVFYNWGGVAGKSLSFIDNEPSPYVGHIDLQNSLVLAERMKSQERRVQPSGVDTEYDSAGGYQSGPNGPTGEITFKKSKKRRRASSPSQFPFGGSYRIPQQGQLQIVIKNPNKTAVKLFLVPYELTGMKAGTKTFIRQRCYSTEPLDEDFSLRPEKKAAFAKQVDKKPTLRYLIHLNICSPCKGRFYLYQHIRVVFANRVPDNKEQLQNEIQIPQPRYSIYKPSRDSLTSQNPGVDERPSAEKAFRRRSSGFGFPVDSLPPVNHASFPYSHDSPNFTFQAPPLPTPAIPPINLNLSSSQRRVPGFALNQKDSPMSDFKGNLPPPPDTDLPDGRHSPLEIVDGLQNFGTVSASHRSSPSGGNGSERSYEKLGRLDGFFGRPATPESGEGLLARKLRGL